MAYERALRANFPAARYGPRALIESDELRDTLTDPHIPPARRQEIVETLLDGKASHVTVSLVSMVVAAGRAPAIAVETSD